MLTFFIVLACAAYAVQTVATVMVVYHGIRYLWRTKPEPDGYGGFI